MQELIGIQKDIHGEFIGDYIGHLQNRYPAHAIFIDPTGGRRPKASAPCFVNVIGMCRISVLYMLYFLDVPYLIPLRLAR